VDGYRLRAGAGLTVEVMNYGVAIHRLLLPTENGELIAVALSLETLGDCIRNDRHRFGATIGRYATRIRGFRDAPHQAHFSSTGLEPDRVFTSTTRYVFGATASNEDDAE
jgi:galactose mutarotase-like enzyme